MTTALHKLLCMICGEELREDTITHEERREDNLYLFHNVPVRICNACGQVWIDEEVLQGIDLLIVDALKRKVETLIFDFPRAQAWKQLIAVMDRVHAQQPPSTKSDQEEGEEIARVIKKYRKAHD